jgi:hypothetical protein
MTMSEYDDPNEDGAVDIIYLVDRLEELVGMGKRMPFSNRVMVEEGEFLALIDQLRVAVPNEIRMAQRVIRERERIIADAQNEAAKILKTARERAEYAVSEHGIVQEAMQQSEEILRQAEERKRRTMGEVDVFALEQFAKVEEAVREGLEIVERAMADTLEKLERGRAEIAG